jgi:NADPH-dependent 2,4-dienoyl-CoA reductase/sulfur reductase-like enzyme/peroxiredoxin family protein/rhodanese-related sulfurtransferase/TusA-related sulfurtransferase
MKVLIVGGVAGGASTAARLRRMDENAEIILFERGPYVSFANCGLPYHIGGSIPERDQLLVSTPESLRDTLNIDPRTFSEVTAIDRELKTVQVHNLQTDETYTENYDKLVLATGASPIVPPLPGVDSPGVFVLHNIPEMDAIIDWIKTRDPRKAVVVGGGFIGLEVAENLVEKGLQVSVVEMLPQVMAPFDFEMAQIIHQHLGLHQVQLHLGDGLKGVQSVADGLQVDLTSGTSLPADLVILAIGVRPENALAKGAGLELGPKGHIVTNAQMQTSDADIYAVGDAVQVMNFQTKQPTALALAGPASRQARTAANHIAGKKAAFSGVIGTSAVKIFDYTAAATGLNSKQLEAAKLPFSSVTVHTNNHVSYYPGSAPISLKLIYGPEGQIYGAQAVGSSGVEKRIDVLATAIRGHLTVYDLEELELAYAPAYGAPRDPVNNAGYAAANQLRGEMPVKYWNEVKDLDPQAWFLLDVREPEELALGVIPGVVNIPLHELRKHIDEIPHDKKILVNCQTGQRSYFAVRILLQHGIEAYNLTGGYKTYASAIENFCQSDECERKTVSAVASSPSQTSTTSTDTPSASIKEYQLDACGLQCPGPVLQLYKQVQQMQDGDVVTVKATDFGFASDVGAWSRSTGNTLLSVETKDGQIVARVQKGLAQKSTLPEAGNVLSKEKKDLTMVVFSGDLDKAIAAFIIANGFASMGQKATLFFTFWGLNILRKDVAPQVDKNMIEKMFGMMMPQGANKLSLSQMSMLGAGTKMIKDIMKAKNVDSLPEMIATAQKNGVRLLACQMSMDLMGIHLEELLDGVEVAGVATMAESATESNTHFFI